MREPVTPPRPETFREWYERVHGTAFHTIVLCTTSALCEVVERYAADRVIEALGKRQPRTR